MIFELQGFKRRATYIFFYELIAIAITSLALAYGSDNSLANATVLSIITSAIAIVWNLLFNYLFELWESRQYSRQRTLKRRVAHAIGFEAGLLLVFVPLFALWLNVSFAKAFVLDLGFLIFFLIYSFCFNWIFDILFGVPNSAKAKDTEASTPHLF